MKVIVENKLSQLLVCTLKDGSSLILNANASKELKKDLLSDMVQEWEKKNFISIIPLNEEVEDKKITKVKTSKKEVKENKEEK